MLSIRLTMSLFVAAMIAAVLVLMVSPEADAQPVVNWQPAQLAVQVEQGSETTATVQYQSSRSIPAGTFFVTPSLYPVLALGTSTPTLQAGLSQSIEVFVTAPSTALPGQVFEGTIHIRNGNATTARPLPVRVEVTKPSFTSLGRKISYQIPSGWNQSEFELSETKYNALYSPASIQQIKAGVAMIPPDISITMTEKSEASDLFDYVSVSETYQYYASTTFRTIAGFPALRLDDSESIPSRDPAVVYLVDLGNRVAHIRVVYSAVGSEDFLLNSIIFE